MLELRIRNRDFLRPYEPVVPDSHFTLQAQREVIERGVHQWENGEGYAFGIFLAETDQLIGRVHLSNAVRRAWQNCTIGYFMDQEQNGRGLMSEAVRLAVQFAFQEAGLHRIEAAVMPGNTGSIRVLEKAGFQYIGLSRYHLRIHGVWEDHKLYAITRGCGK
ncbi:GNAT family N-acetyltransferase [Paenactinomyces guangxiensis]|uniref:GNAT family N-acetyltransferase n=1 Tax=Paenactinomyces guangxiensis TaxID=1490290 RepID=UPI001C687CD6|nr:GNAT family protein [Paenactinomyces guangxiensis]